MGHKREKKGGETTAKSGDLRWMSEVYCRRFPLVALLKSECDSATQLAQVPAFHEELAEHFAVS